MTEAELMAHKKIRPEIAARFLQDGTTAQDIRVSAQMGMCPFCVAVRPSGRRWTYRVNPGLLIKYKAGDLGLQNYASARTKEPEITGTDKF